MEKIQPQKSIKTKDIKFLFLVFWHKEFGDKKIYVKSIISATYLGCILLWSQQFYFYFYSTYMENIQPQKSINLKI